MKKTVYTLCVNNYCPELCSLTLPNHKEYADRIGADFVVITDRKYPEWHPTYEKVQIWDLGKENDWNIHIDADILVSPDLWDVTEGKPLWQIGWYSLYDASLYFKCDRVFARDRRQAGICSSFLAVPTLCHELWEPFACSYQEALTGINKPHGIDDYCFSLNFARYGMQGAFFFEHDGDLNKIVHLEVGGDCSDQHSVVQRAKEILDTWKK